MKPDGTNRSCRKYRRIVDVTIRNTSAATNQSMNTCLVIEKSIPPRRGSSIKGCS